VLSNLLIDDSIMKNIKLVIFLSLLTICFSAFAEDEIEEVVAPPKIHTYSVKGVIKQLPNQAGKQSPMLIKHEAIPTYVGAEGEVVGMQAMTMPFFVADGLDLSSVKAGDCVEFKFESWWGEKPGDKVTEIKKVDCPS
jgi:Cu/Ag efflux protein CusF